MLLHPIIRGFPICWACMALSRPFEEESNTFYASLLQVVDVVMPLALCRQVLSQALSTETQAACDDCPPPPPPQSVCSHSASASSRERDV